MLRVVRQHLPRLLLINIEPYVSAVALVHLVWSLVPRDVAKQSMLHVILLYICCE